MSYFSKFVTRTVDPREAAEHFRAFVEGAAEQALRDPDNLRLMNYVVWRTRNTEGSTSSSSTRGI